MSAERPTTTDRQGSGPGISADLEERLDSAVEKLVAQPRVKQALVAIESMDQSIQWSSASAPRHSDYVPVRLDATFWIASVTKMFIASATLILVERGSVKLDAPIGDYLPGSLIGGLHRLNGVDYTPAITVRHLLGHTSGLPDFLEGPGRGEPGLFDRVIAADRRWTLEEILQIVRGSLRPHFPPQPVDAPRQRARYSDTNFQLLIAIIEHITGQHIGDAFQDLICRPLGLGNTFHPVHLDHNRTRPSPLWHDDQLVEIPLALESFHDLFSTVDDLFVFMRALMRGEVFADLGTADLMTSRFNALSFALSPVAPSWPMQYGLGIMRYQLPRLFTPIKPVPALIGHTGVSGSWLFFCPKLDLLLAGTVDQLSAPDVPYRFLPGLVRMLDDHLAR